MYGIEAYLRWCFSSPLRPRDSIEAELIRDMLSVIEKARLGMT